MIKRQFKVERQLTCKQDFLNHWSVEQAEREQKPDRETMIQKGRERKN